MPETKEEKLLRLQQEYQVLQQELAQEKADDPVKMRDKLYQILYASILRHGVAEEAPSIAVIQVPATIPDPNHVITWNLADDKRSLFVRIVKREEPQKEGGNITIGNKVDEEAEEARNEVMS